MSIILMCSKFKVCTVYKQGVCDSIICLEEVCMARDVVQIIGQCERGREKGGEKGRKKGRERKRKPSTCGPFIVQRCVICIPISLVARQVGMCLSQKVINHVVH